MHPSHPPPEAVLIRLIRQAAHITIAAAAKRAGISTARWTQIEQGYETRGGERKPAWAPPDTLAYMAAAIGLPPDRLEAEGQRPDAAAVLREMQHRRPAPAPAAASDLPDDDPVLVYVRGLPGLTPQEREALESVARSRGIDVALRQGMVGFVLTMWAQQAQERNRSA